MNKIFALFLLFATLTTAQAKECKGQIIFEDDSIENVTFRIWSFLGGLEIESVQYRAIYLDTNGNVKTLEATDAKEIRFTVDDEVYRMVSRKNDYIRDNGRLSYSRIFMRCFVEGKLSLYVLYYNSGERVSAESLLLREGDNQKFWTPKLHHIKKSLKSFFSDCPALVNKIANKELRWTDRPYQPNKNIARAKKIVEFYNANYGD